MNRKDRNHHRSFAQGRKNGWGVGLYRHPSDGWFGGVCAGLSEYWEVPVWITRLSAFALFLFTGSIIFWFYIAAWILIGRRLSRWEGEVYEGKIIKEYSADRNEYRRRSAFRSAESPSARIAKAHDRVREAEREIIAMERYVISSRYDLGKEFSRL